MNKRQSRVVQRRHSVSVKFVLSHTHWKQMYWPQMEDVFGMQTFIMSFKISVTSIRGWHIKYMNLYVYTLHQGFSISLFHRDFVNHYDSQSSQEI